MPGFWVSVPPKFDGQGYYVGPLPLAKGMGSIRGRQAKGPFKTSGTECWPPKMCQWIAALLMATSSIDTQDSYPVCQPEGGRLQGDHGPPRQCDILEGFKPFHDGGGLCSPGRWPHDRRLLAEGDKWSWLRNRLWEVACKHAGSELPNGYWWRERLQASPE